MNDFSKPTVATNAEFTSTGGDVLLVANGAETFHIITGPSGPSLLFPHSDAPAIALAILKAAGFVPRGNRIDSDSFQESVDTAAGYLDDAVLIQAGTAAKKELIKRRDQLAVELVAFGATYADVIPAIQNAINIIIRIQDEATK